MTVKHRSIQNFDPISSSINYIVCSVFKTSLYMIFETMVYWKGLALNKDNNKWNVTLISSHVLIMIRVIDMQHISQKSWHQMVRCQQEGKGRRKKKQIFYGHADIFHALHTSTVSKMSIHYESGLCYFRNIHPLWEAACAISEIDFFVCKIHFRTHRIII